MVGRRSQRNRPDLSRLLEKRSHRHCQGHSAAGGAPADQHRPRDTARF